LILSHQHIILGLLTASSTLAAENDTTPLFAELLKSPVLAQVLNASQVGCGVDFTVWLCKGQLYSAGNPQYGQLGHGTDHEYNAKECEAPPHPFPYIEPPWALPLTNGESGFRNREPSPPSLGLATLGVYSEGS
jgi:hypothetical protein